MKEIRLLNKDEIEVKIKQVTEKGAIALIYKNARVDMAILDDVFGAMNWEAEYKEVKGNLYCGIGARDSEDKPFVWKWNCGIESRADDDGNEKKGEASDAFKRAGFLWGIGRELYTSPFIFLALETERDGSKFKLKNKFVKLRVSEIEYTNRVISKLVIVDEKNNKLFQYGTKSNFNAIVPVPNAKIVIDKPIKPQNCFDFVIPFGKYATKTIGDVIKTDRVYIKWIAEKATSQEAKDAAWEALKQTIADEGEAL